MVLLEMLDPKDLKDCRETKAHWEVVDRRGQMVHRVYQGNLANRESKVHQVTMDPPDQMVKKVKQDCQVCPDDKGSKEDRAKTVDEDLGASQEQEVLQVIRVSRENQV